MKSEQQVQTNLIKQLSKEGYFVIKLIQTNKNGIPDLLLLKDGQASFIEVKTAKGKLSGLQKHRIEELKQYGCKTDVIYGD